MSSDETSPTSRGGVPFRARTPTPRVGTVVLGRLRSLDPSSIIGRRARAPLEKRRGQLEAAPVKTRSY
jgi:hypothetical protein